ncbi:MAG: amino acid adenylation domain-containing protein [Xenococcaceae cyanobacterium]
MIYLIPHVIDQSAERFPEREAFRFESQSLTYAALVRQANSLAHMLRDRGVQQGDRVGIYLNKSLESAIAIYGIMKAGAAYVPLDPVAPAARLAFILQNCGIRHLITHAAKRSLLPELIAEKTPLECIIGLSSETDLPVPTISWEAVWEMPGESPPNVRTMEQNLAYIMYTSGSTGDPKGIMHTHYSGLSYAKMAAHTYGLDCEDRLSNHSPLHFDMSTLDYFSGPLAGATTIIIPEAYTKLPASLSKLIEDEKLTIWYSVPFAPIQLLRRGILHNRNLSSLRWVLFGGEPFPPKYLYALMKQLPNARFSNVYGPAEVNQCAYYHVPTLDTDDNAVPDEAVPIGKIWANAEELVVDDQDRPVISGEVGELLVRTPTMMRGYWKRPDLDKRAFFRRPVFGHQEDVFYRTGDLVQLQPDGNYRFLGRKDRQIKTRGYRVELDEIEGALVSHVHVEEAGVFPVSDKEGSQRIEAVVTIKAGRVVTPADLTRHVAARLPWYAVPVKVAIADVLPRTTTGKIDRRALQKQALTDRF